MFEVPLVAVWRLDTKSSLQAVQGCEQSEVAVWREEICLSGKSEGWYA